MKVKSANRVPDRAVRDRLLTRGLGLFMMLSMMLSATQAVAIPLWTPADLGSTNLLGWYDASDTNTLWANTAGTTRATNSVARWDDKSGNGRHATAGTAVNQPSTGTRTINGSNCLNFVDPNYMDIASTGLMPASGNIAIFQVLHFDGVSSVAAQSIAIGGDRFGLRSTDGGNLNNVGTELVNVNFSAGTYTQGLWGAVATTNDTRWRGYFNGTLKATYTTYTTKFATGASRLMAKNGNPQYARGGLGETLIVEDAPTETRQRIEGYLAWKWGMQANLPAGHPYMDAAPLVAPDNPAGLTAIAGAGGLASVLLSWDAASNATGYLVKRSYTNSGYTVIGTTTNTSYIDYSVKFMTNYYYVVAATNSLYFQSDSDSVMIKLNLPGTVIMIR
jgi:hypothetical protein